MKAIVSVTSAIIAGLLIAGCAVTAVDGRPRPATSTSLASDPSCLHGTASRIPTSAATCTAGRSYTDDDISRTGKTSAGDALSLLDPSITIHH